MKMQTKPQDVSVHGNFNTTQFKTGDISLLVDMMADYIYSEKERAVLRELCVNAHDSTLRSGNIDSAIEVCLPTTLLPDFSVRDSGTGLSDENVRNKFAGIGISDKRDNEQETGCFGVGTLSPYSVCDQFNVTSFYGDKVTHYLCFRDETRKPQVAELYCRDRDKNNHDDREGLLISMTVDDRVAKFQEEAVNVFRYWQGTTINTNSDEVNRKIQSSEDIVIENDEVMLRHSGGYGDNLMAWQGNICYEIFDYDWDTVGKELPVNNYAIRHLLNCTGMLKFCVKDDALSFDVSREKLESSPENALKIKKKVCRVIKSLQANAESVIEEITTPLDKALKAYQLSQGSTGRALGYSDVSGDGSLWEKYQLKTTDDHVCWSATYRSSNKTSTKYVSVKDFKNTLYAIEKPRMQARIKYHLKDTHINHIVLLTQEQVDEVGITSEQLFDLETLPKVPRSVSSTRASNGKKYSTCKTFSVDLDYKGWQDKQYWKETTLTIDEDVKYFVEISRWQMVSSGVQNNSTRELIRALKLAKEAGLDVPEVYALKTSFMETKKFKSGNFVPMKKWFSDVVLPELPESKFFFNFGDIEDAKGLRKIFNHPELEQLFAIVDARSPSEFHMQVQEAFGTMFMGDKQYFHTGNYNSRNSGNAEYDKLKPRLEKEFRAFYEKYILLDNLSSYSMRENSKMIDGLVEYMGGTNIHPKKSKKTA